jgi:hypothetical protein
MARYFSMCEPGDGVPSNPLQVVADTTAGTFNSSRQRCSVSIPTASSYLDTPPFLDAAAPTTIWVMGTINHNSAGGGNNLMELINSTGTPVFRCYNPNNGIMGFQVDWWNGSAWVTGGTGASYNLLVMHKIVIKLICGASGSFQVWVNGALVYSGNITSANCNNVAKVRYRAATTASWSEMAGADFDLRDVVIRNDPPTGASATHTSWTGTYTDVDDTTINDTDLITASSGSLRESYTHTSYTIPTGYSINSVWIVGRGSVNGAGPSDAKFFLRAASTDYDGSTLSLTSGLEPRAAYWATNPSGGAWAQAGYDAVEMGVVSVT